METLIKFTVKHHYKEIPIEITVEAATTRLLDLELEMTIKWLIRSRKLIDKFYEQTKKLTEKGLKDEV